MTLHEFEAAVASAVGIDGLESGAPASQRWQAVRSLECYRQIARATQRHQPDLEERFDEVYWPVALSRSYPSRQRLRDKRSGNRWRPG